MKSGMVARIIDARPRFARHGGDPRGDGGDGLVGDAGEFFSVVVAAEKLPERAIRSAHAVEVAVDQYVGDAAFLLNAFRQRLIGIVHVADIDNQVGLERFERVDIDLGIAAAGEARNFRPGGNVGKQELARFGGYRLEPSDQEIGRERVNLDRCRRAGRINAHDAVWAGYRAAGGVGDARGKTRQRRDERRR